MPVHELRLGEPRPFPEDLLLRYNVTCYACGGAVDPHQAYTMRDGAVVRERVGPRIAATSGLAGRLLGVETSADLGLWYATVCVAGSCGLEGLDEEAQAALVSSSDGGATWQSVTTYSGWLNMAGVLDGQVVAQAYTEADGRGPIQFLPAGVLADQPDFVDDLPLGPPPPSVWQSFGMVWWQQDGDGGLFYPYDANGNRLIAPPGMADHWQAEFVGGRFYVTWQIDPSPARFLSVYDVEAQTLGHYVWSDPGVVLWFADAIGPSTVLANVYMRGDPDNPRGTNLIEPVIIDLEAGTVHVIQRLTDGLEGNAHPFLEGAAIGPWARVDGSGTCLNVREEPSTDAAIVDCHVDGVLLRDIGELTEPKASNGSR